MLKIHRNSKYFAASEQLNAVQTSFELVSEQFNLGMKNTTDLLSEKNKLISAQQDLIVAKYRAMYNTLRATLSLTKS